MVGSNLETLPPDLRNNLMYNSESPNTLFNRHIGDEKSTESVLWS